MRNILTEKRQWCKVEIGKKTEKYAQTASESLFEKRYIVYKITTNRDSDNHRHNNQIKMIMIWV